MCVYPLYIYMYMYVYVYILKREIHKHISKTSSVHFYCLSLYDFGDTTLCWINNDEAHFWERLNLSLSAIISFLSFFFQEREPVRFSLFCVNSGNTMKEGQGWLPVLGDQESCCVTASPSNSCINRTRITTASKETIFVCLTMFTSVFMIVAVKLFCISQE